MSRDTPAPVNRLFATTARCALVAREAIKSGGEHSHLLPAQNTSVVLASSGEFSLSLSSINARQGLAAHWEHCLN